MPLSSVPWPALWSINLKSPDIIALEEVQDNNGATDDSVVNATNTYNMLLSAIQAAGDRMLARALTANLPPSG